FAPGDPREGVIVVPYAALPAVLYRPGTVAPHEGRPLFTYCVCGDPDCHRLVRREFAPGHDAKRKAMLWRRARDGAEALEELRARGWKPPPEMR
ncbi:MAG: hypothetical protein ACRDGK_06515, partial [Actinomycetota bacterium]